MVQQPWSAQANYYAALNRLMDLWLFRFDQIPKIAIQIFENGYDPIRRIFGLPDELDACRKHLIIVTPEVIRAQEKENPATGLAADEGSLLGC